MDNALARAFIFLATTAIKAIARDEVDNNIGVLVLILEAYRQSPMDIREQRMLVRLHDHTDMTKLGFDREELDGIIKHVRETAAANGADDESSSSSSSEDDNPGDDKARAGNFSSPASDDEDEDNDDNDSPGPVMRVFPPCLTEGTDIGSYDNDWGFRCDLCRHICRQPRHFYAHFKEGRGVEGLRIFRAMKAERVWWARDPAGNEYTGELVPLFARPVQGPIPPPCGDAVRAANRVRSRRKAAAKANKSVESKAEVSTANGKPNRAQMANRERGLERKSK